MTAVATARPTAWSTTSRAPRRLRSPRAPTGVPESPLRDLLDRLPGVFYLLYTGVLTTGTQPGHRRPALDDLLPGLDGGLRRDHRGPVQRPGDRDRAQAGLGSPAPVTPLQPSLYVVTKLLVVVDPDHPVARARVPRGHAPEPRVGRRRRTWSPWSWRWPSDRCRSRRSGSSLATRSTATSARARR